MKTKFNYNFENILQSAAIIHNSSPHAATGNTPYFLLFGVEPTMPHWQEIQQQEKNIENRNLRRKEEQKKIIYKKLLAADNELKIIK